MTKKQKEILLDNIEYLFENYIIEELEMAIHSGQIKKLERLSYIFKRISYAKEELQRLIENI